jgi:hypothetical protein
MDSWVEEDHDLTLESSTGVTRDSLVAENEALRATCAEALSMLEVMAAKLRQVLAPPSLFDSVATDEDGGGASPWMHAPEEDLSQLSPQPPFASAPTPGFRITVVAKGDIVARRPWLRPPSVPSPIVPTARHGRRQRDSAGQDRGTPFDSAPFNHW